MQGLRCDHVGAIRKGIIRIGMDFKEKAIHTHGRSRSRQRGDKLAPSTGALAFPSWGLNGMGRIEHHRKAQVFKDDE